MTNLPNTQFICKSPTQVQNSEYFGNRGINLIKDNVYMQFSQLSSAVPSINSNKTVIDQTVFSDSNSEDITIWLRGFFSPQTDSLYEFIINSNGEAILYLSTDTTLANRDLVSSTQFGSTNKKVQLKANNK